MWVMTKSDHDELTAYRRLGLSPDEIAAKLAYLNDPAPLPLYDDEDGYSAAAGILEDDEVIVTTYASLDNEKWEK